MAQWVRHSPHEPNNLNPNPATHTKVERTNPAKFSYLYTHAKECTHPTHRVCTPKKKTKQTPHICLQANFMEVFSQLSFPHFRCLGQVTQN